jgi:hypothetical protein
VRSAQPAGHRQDPARTVHKGQASGLGIEPVDRAGTPRQDRPHESILWLEIGAVHLPVQLERLLDTVATFAEDGSITDS